MKRYTEQLKNSLLYHWWVFRECLNILLGLRFWVAGFLVVLYFFPYMVFLSPLETNEYLDWYTRTPVPPFELHLSMELETTAYFERLRDDISALLAANYYMVASSEFKTLAGALSWVAIGLLTIAYLREGTLAIDREG